MAFSQPAHTIPGYFFESAHYMAALTSKGCAVQQNQPRSVVIPFSLSRACESPTARCCSRRWTATDTCMYSIIRSTDVDWTVLLRTYRYVPVRAMYYSWEPPRCVRTKSTTTRRNNNLHRNICSSAQQELPACRTPIRTAIHSSSDLLQRYYFGGSSMDGSSCRMAMVSGSG